jgi:ABC-2 type transport system ATP-binding protein
MDLAIRAEALSKTYRSRRRSLTAVESLTLHVQRGEIFGLLGPNGAGKTTTIRMICGLLEPTSGRVFVDGLSVHDQRTEAARRIGLVPEDAGHHANLTFLEELVYYGSMYGLDRAAVVRRAEPLAARLAIDSRFHDRLKTFSRGMRRKVHLIRSLLHEPMVLVLDEPTAGLDPHITLEVWDLLRSLAQQGTTIVICSHHLEEVQRLCDRVAIIRRRLLAEGTVASLVGGAAGVSVTVIGGAEPWAESARAISGVSSVAAVGEELTIAFTGDATAVVPAIVRELVNRGAAITAVRPVESDLRAVFSRIIGEAMNQTAEAVA